MTDPRSHTRHATTRLQVPRNSAGWDALTPEQRAKISNDKPRETLRAVEQFMHLPEAAELINNAMLSVVLVPLHRTLLTNIADYNANRPDVLALLAPAYAGFEPELFLRRPDLFQSLSEAQMKACVEIANTPHNYSLKPSPPQPAADAPGNANPERMVKLAREMGLKTVFEVSSGEGQRTR